MMGLADLDSLGHMMARRRGNIVGMHNLLTSSLCYHQQPPCRLAAHWAGSPGGAPCITCSITLQL